MSMKVACDKCGYILGGIEVKENYGCNACNPFFFSPPTDKNNFVNSSIDIPKAPTRPPLLIKYCGICGMILIQTPIGTYYDTDTAEKYNHWRFRCPQYRWWKIWDRYHSNWRCNEDGSTYSYEA